MTENRVSELDFDRIKDNLKIFLENEPQLSSYNFTGSTMNIIMDLLSYVTHYNAIYANQQLNETFLDTALLRSSVVSRAKELGYIPRQFTSAFTEVEISVRMPNGDTRTSVDILKGTTFSGERSGQAVSFVTTEQFTLTEKVGNVFSGNIVIRQGEYVTDRFTFDAQENNPTFVLTPEKVDSRFIEVEVLPFANSSQRDIFNLGDNIVNIESESNVYFLQENENGDVEIFFGDGILGAALSNGNEIRVNSISTLGIDGNDVSTFSITQNIDDINRSAITISNILPSSGGDDRESIDSIKFLAPKVFTTQDRLVTAADYEAYIPSTFGNVQSLSVWSGDENVPPSFGRVFVSVKPIGADRLSQFERSEYLADLNQKKIIGINIELVDPELLYVDVITSATYDRQNSLFFASQFQTIVSQSISAFFNNNLGNLGDGLVYSQLVSTIDDANDSIIGNLTELRINKKFIPSSNETTYLLDFANSIEEGTVTSRVWTDGLNSFQIKSNDTRLELFRDDILLNNNVGSINYDTGLLELRNFTPSITSNTEIVMVGKPLSNNIQSLRNNLLVVDNIDVEIVEG